jgi:hypothetical protein
MQKTITPPGIKSSWAFYNIPETGAFTAFFLHPGASLGTSDAYIVNVNFDDYYAKEPVKYAGNNATGLTQILQQRLSCLVPSLWFGILFQLAQNRSAYFHNRFGYGEQ